MCGVYLVVWCVSVFFVKNVIIMIITSIPEIKIMIIVTVTFLLFLRDQFVQKKHFARATHKVNVRVRHAWRRLSHDARKKGRCPVRKCWCDCCCGDVKTAFLLADREERAKKTSLCDHAEVVRQRSDQLFEVGQGHGLGDQPQQWWRTFEKFVIKQLGFRPASDGSLCIRSERALESLERVARRCVGDPLWRCWFSP